MKKKSEFEMEMITEAVSGTLGPISPNVERGARLGDARILGMLAEAQSAASPTQKYGKNAGKRLVSALETENMDLRKQVVELALEILDLQVRLRPDERSRWGDIGTR
jgi:hypothetical protein